MARQPENDFPDEIVSDRDIAPLNSTQARLPTVFFVIAAGAGILLLLALQIFDRGNDAVLEEELDTFAPTIDMDAQLPDFPEVEIPLPEPEVEEFDDGYDDLNILELERLRQMALLEEQKLKLLQAQQAAAMAERDRRRESEMMLFDGTTSVESNGSASFSETVGSDGQPNDFAFGVDQDTNEYNEIITNKSERFLRDASDVEVVEAKALQLQDHDFLLTQGTFITGITETMINSDLPGMIRAIVDKPVYGRTGKHLLVPKGSRLIGRYQSGLDVGQKRVYIVWSRLERPDGVIVEIGSPGADRIGQAGMTGNVDKHLIEIFGASTLLTTLPVIPALLQNDNQSANQTQVIEGARDGFNQAAAIALQNSINIAPTITVPQGSEITIFVNRDLSFKGVH